MSKLQRPSPNWYAWTQTCLVIPARSARGTIRGITIAAWPAAEGIKIFTRILKITMNPAPSTAPMDIRGLLKALTIVSITPPALSRRETALAKPITNDAPKTGLIPSINFREISFILKPEAKPVKIAIPRKKAAICLAPNRKRIVQTIQATTPAAKTQRVTFWRVVITSPCVWELSNEDIPKTWSRFIPAT